MIANEEWAYEAHVVLCLRLNYIRLVLQLVHAYSVDKQMGTNKALHSTEPHNNVLCTKRCTELRCLQNHFESAYPYPLLTEFKDVAEQGFLDHL
jgi:hypothetical protein